MENIKEKCDNYVYKNKKVPSIDIFKFKHILRIIDNFKRSSYIDIILGNDVKESFKELHFLKMLKHYYYINFYHNNIKKLNRNERLLCYIEEVINKDYYYNFLNIKICYEII